MTGFCASGYNGLVFSFFAMLLVCVQPVRLICCSATSLTAPGESLHEQPHSGQDNAGSFRSTSVNDGYIKLPPSFSHLVSELIDYIKSAFSQSSSNLFDK